jgi:hypothetical protein
LEVSLELPLSNNNLQHRFDLDRSRFFNKEEGGTFEFSEEATAQLIAHSSFSKYTSPINGFGVRTNLQNHVITSTNACNGVCNSLSDCKGIQDLYGSRSYGTGKWEKNGYARAFRT